MFESILGTERGSAQRSAFRALHHADDDNPPTTWQ